MENKMFVLRQTCLRKAPAFTVAVLLLLATRGKSEMLSDSTLTTASPFLSNLSLTDQAVNSSMGEPKVGLFGTPCGEENKNFCLNGGKCIYPQDSNKPSCICSTLHDGIRCENPIGFTYKPLGAEKVIAIIFGLIMVFIILGLAVCCFVRKRCVKSAPLIKAAASETSV